MILIFRFDDRRRRHDRNAERRRREQPTPFDDQDTPVRLLLQHLQQSAHRFYVPERRLCIDEALIKFSGNTVLKVFDHSKPGTMTNIMITLNNKDFVTGTKIGGPNQF